MAGTYCITDLLDLAVREGAKALLLDCGAPPLLHTAGPPRQLELPALTYGDVSALFSAIASAQQKDELAKCGDIHFVYSSPRCGGFAVRATEQPPSFKVMIKPL